MDTRFSLLHLGSIQPANMMCLFNLACGFLNKEWRVNTELLQSWSVVTSLSYTWLTLYQTSIDHRMNSHSLLEESVWYLKEFTHMLVLCCTQANCFIDSHTTVQFFEVSRTGIEIVLYCTYQG